MLEYISVKKLSKGTTQIRILPVQGSKNRYDIYFYEYKGASKFLNSICSQSAVSSRISSETVMSGSFINIIFDNVKDDSIQPSYTVILDNNEWVENNIKDIEKQLVGQAKRFEYEVTLKNNTRLIEQAIQTNNYASLIQTMIQQNSERLTDVDINNIQTTLSEVKAQKIGNKTLQNLGV